VTQTRHMKRYAAPKSWPVSRKEETWVPKMRPGPHNEETAMPLVLVLREVLGMVDNTKEAKRVLHQGKVLVDGVVRHDHRFPVGVFDVVSIPEMKGNWRVMLDSRGKLVLREVKGGAQKLVKITGKTTVRGGRTQLHFHDGTNLFTDEKYPTRGSLVLDLPDRKVASHLPFGPGALAMIIGGGHAGEQGRIREVRVQRSSRPNAVVLEGADGEPFETVEHYVYVIGKDQPAVDLGVEK